MNPAPERLAGIAFGRFQVLPDRREVLADGRPVRLGGGRLPPAAGVRPRAGGARRADGGRVRLGGRAFDVLLALIEARGAVVGKDALKARVWPGRIIEDNSLAA